jgi:hypothetical protein
MWAGHHAAALTVLVLALNLVSDALPTGKRFLVNDPALLVIVVVFSSTAYHSRRLCERCAARSPLNGQACAEARARALRWAHLYYGSSRFNLAVWGGWGLLLAIVALTHPPQVLQGTPFYLLVANLAVSLYLDAVHRRLYPWCPYCHWRGGGDHEEVPAPTPTPQGAGVS